MHGAVCRSSKVKELVTGAPKALLVKGTTLKKKKTDLSGISREYQNAKELDCYL